MRRFVILAVTAWVAGLGFVAFANAGGGHGGGGGGGGGGGSFHATAGHAPSQPANGASAQEKSGKGNTSSGTTFLKFNFKQVAVKTVSWSKSPGSRGGKPRANSNTGLKVGQ